MLYFGTTCTNPRIIAAMQAGQLAMIATPRQYNPVPDGVTWCADNGAFGKGWPGDDQFVRFLKDMRPGIARCKFAVAPDVPFDHKATLERSVPWLSRIRELGYPAALAVQDGGRSQDLPWGEFDVLFIGGSDDFKVSEEVIEMVAEARLRGLWVHLGRVNSLKRIMWAKYLGCHSGDGQFLRFAPDHNLGRMLRYLAKAEARSAGQVEAWQMFAAWHPDYRARLVDYRDAAEAVAGA